MYTLPNISIKTNSNFKFTICFIIYLVSNKSTFEYPYQYKNIKLCSTYQTKKKKKMHTFVVLYHLSIINL